MDGWMDGWTHLWEGVFVCVFLYARVHKINEKFAECFSFLLVLPIKKKIRIDSKSKKKIMPPINQVLNKIRLTPGSFKMYMAVHLPQAS